MDASKREVFVVGHRGYLGAYCLQELQRKRPDLTLRFPAGSTRGRDAAGIETADVVLYFGGLVGSQACNRCTERAVFDANVGDVMAVGARMKPGALLLYASTAALYEGYGMTEPDETALLHTHLFDAYTRSMYCRESNLRTLSHIRTVGLRLATCTGISPVQKKTSIYIKMLRDAVLHGKIHVQGAHMGRSILWLPDLLHAVEHIIDNRLPAGAASVRFPPHRIYNVCSFNSTVAKIANELGCKTGCNVVFEPDCATDQRTLGFSMNSSRLQHDHNIHFEGSNRVLVDELIQHIKHVCHSDDYLRPVPDAAQCRVCKRSERMAVLYDFGTQPNANHYLSRHDPHRQGDLPVHPLRLDVCRNCYHTQISYTLPPADVFSNYIYLSGTSTTMRHFFRDFAAKTVAETGVMHNGHVLEIACNDGSLLDWYQALGWTTYGYDPAANIHAISSAKGHRVTVGFWGTDPVPDDYPPFDLVVAQNVCAHVPDPVAFLAACRKVMHDRTLLYIQTSQSEMIERGQYDTAYHEHLSFFTVRSMNIAANMAGLVVDDVEKVDVHGSSYLFRLRLASSVDITQHPLYLYERNIGLYDDLLYYVFVEKVNELGRWLRALSSGTHAVLGTTPWVGYGAAAKGMTVLNSLDWRLPLHYIVDDSPCKQGYLATNRKYPIVSPSTFRDYAPLCVDGSHEAVVVFVLAWNFLPEIKERTKALRPGMTTYFVVTYPLKAIWYVDASGQEYKVFEEIDTRYVPEKSTFHKNILISHFYNEEALLTQWIRHHAPLFDCAVLIDYHSTDRSRDILKREAPASWNVVYSQNREFGAVAIDAEVAGYENSFDNHHWRLALTTTEFLNTVGLRRKDNPTFQQLQDSAVAIRIPSVTVVERENGSLSPSGHTQRPSVSLLRDKNTYYFQGDAGSSTVLTAEEERYVNNHYNRFMHRVRDFHNPYHVGRHEFKHPSVLQNMHILKYVYAPFPEMYSRKLQIKTRMPESDKQFGFGHQHLVEYDQLDADYRRKQSLPLVATNDLQGQMAYFDRYMREVSPVDEPDQLLYGIYCNMFGEEWNT
jgi:nucleoside-diphosphate-sugar epimerase/2-polyprenyl-3-methyl-5-hydroxy-6-metoxy-1,4-benzoquinol methylase